MSEDRDCYCDEDQGAGYTYSDEHGDCDVCLSKEVTYTKANKNCMLSIVDGKVYCSICNGFHDIDNNDDCYKHKTVQLGMKHVLYVAYYCEVCDNGKILIDSEQ
jgi:hypothetical protein